MSALLYSLIKDKALATPTKEIGGYIIDDKIHFIDNTAADPTHYYEANVSKYAEIIFHSHIGSVEASETDIWWAAKVNKELLIYSIKDDAFKLYKPNPKYSSKLIGRPYIPGLVDSKELVKDYYLNVLNFVIEEDWFIGAKLYNFTSWPPSFIKREDVIIWNGYQDREYYWGIYMEQNKVLSHKPGELSQIYTIKNPAQDILAVFRK